MGIQMDINRYKQQGMIVERGRLAFNRNICRKKYVVKYVVKKVILNVSFLEIKKVNPTKQYFERTNQHVEKHPRKFINNNPHLNNFRKH